MDFDKIIENKYGFWSFVSGLIILTGIGVYLILTYSGILGGGKYEVVGNPIEAQKIASDIVGKDNTSVVFLGMGGDGHSGGTLTDSIIVLSINTQNKKALAVSIPRDLWVPIPYDWDNTKNFKINSAYAIGIDDVRYANKKPEYRGKDGPGNLVARVVGDITGIPVEHYVAIDFESFRQLIDEVNGIEVTVPGSFDDYYYPIKGLENETCGLTNEEIADAHAKYSGFELEKQFPCRWERISYEKGQKVTLDGETALKFVRSRHGDSDFGRSERQFAVLAGIERKLISLSVLKKGSKVIENLYKLVNTDLDLGTITTLIDFVGNPDEYDFTEVHITEDNLVNSSKTSDGQFILIPKAGNNNFGEIKNFLKGEL